MPLEELGSGFSEYFTQPEKARQDITRYSPRALCAIILVIKA
jgi:hypothetical protein